MVRSWLEIVMAVSFELPQAIEKSLREQLGDLDGAAKEALLVELYRQGKLTQDQLAEALGISGYESEGVLKRHGVYLEITTEEVGGDAKAIRTARDDNGRKPPGADLTPAQRVAAWERWVASMREWGARNLPPGHVVDDSRESIYE